MNRVTVDGAEGRGCSRNPSTAAEKKTVADGEETLKAARTEIGNAEIRAKQEYPKTGDTPAGALWPEIGRV